MMAQGLGASVVIMEMCEPIQFLESIERYTVSLAQVVPTMMVRLLKLPEDVRSRFDLASLRSIMHSAAPCPVQVKSQMIDWVEPILYEYYAGTEGNGFVLCD